MATETAEHASGSGFPPFDQIADTGLSQVFWLIVTFAVLYFAVANVFLPKIRKAVEEVRGEFLAIDSALARLNAGDLCLILVDQVEAALAHIAQRVTTA